MEETKDSYASFVLSNILRSSITLRIANHEPIVKKQLTVINQEKKLIWEPRFEGCVYTTQGQSLVLNI